MTWQDITIGIGQFMFAVALIPAIRDPRNKPPISTCMATFILLIVFAFAYSSMQMWITTASVLLCACGWFALAWQQGRRKSATTLINLQRYRTGRGVEVCKFVYENGVIIGDMVRDVDGFYYFYPALDRNGHWSSEVMKEVAVILDSENAAWDKEVRAMI